ncbi:MAG TPA: pimeloyl-ACP methyl ester esterase BioH [Gammaproteobacteria bacterium]
MKLKIDTVGAGPDLVMLHGWALHCGLFDGIAGALAKTFRVHCIDLPGHGHNAHIELPANIDAAAGLVLDAAPRDAHWLGWSFGGTVALAAASLVPERVRKLLLVASTPRFTVSGDWPHAVAEANLNRMAADLETDFRRTVDNFLALQVLGDERAVTLLRDLREKVFAHGEPAAASLASGLRILHDTDLRSRLSGIRAPLLAIMGGRDRLTPAAAGEALADSVPGGRCVTIAKAAHMPFVSHREEFLELTETFLGQD